MPMFHASTKREALEVGNIREGPCQTKAPCFFLCFCSKDVDRIAQLNLAENL